MWKVYVYIYKEILFDYYNICNFWFDFKKYIVFVRRYIEVYLMGVYIYVIKDVGICKIYLLINNE